MQDIIVILVVIFATIIVVCVLYLVEYLIERVYLYCNVINTSRPSTCEHIGTSPMSKRISVAEQTLKKQIDRILADEMRIQNEIELRIHVGKELANQRMALEAEILRLEVNRAAATPK